mmetsp:Transcript_18838/g.32050  ORF Transcript_18838/g.32050 Transcript_18838/m.32050 type:complete len:132 (+) Transcript_18838:37-432(+)
MGLGKELDIEEDVPSFSKSMLKDDMNDENDLENDGYTYYDEEDESFLDTLYYVLPELKKRWRSIILAIILCLVGIGLFIGSMFSFINGNWGYASSMLILSLICGLPGGYVCFIIFKIIKQDPEYDIHEIPE